jgi:Arc/MetJ-type ribon-helix-helix transcriptional regulator
VFGSRGQSENLPEQQSAARGRRSRSNATHCPALAAPGQLPQGMLSRILKAMDVQLTPDQRAFARRAIESGRLHSEADAVQEALTLWEERERQRAEFLLTLDDARASLARGQGRVISEESMKQLANEVKERGRARLLTDVTTSR